MVGHRTQANPSRIDLYADAHWVGDVTTRLSKTAGTLMHGAHWLEGLPVKQNVRALSSGEPEFHSQGSGTARGLWMKHTCYEAGEPKKSLMLHCDSVASRGVAKKVGSYEMPDTLKSSGCGHSKPWTRRSQQRSMFQPSQTLLRSARPG